MKLLVLSLCLTLVPGVCAAQASSPEQRPTLSIRGKVLQETNGQPIRKAKVQLNGRRGPTAAQYSAVTDEEGHFTIEDVQTGEYVVVVEHTGFVQSNTDSHLRTVSVQPGGGTNDWIFHMQAVAVITGKIVDLDGDPMRDVSVMATKTGSVGAGRRPNDFGNGATNDLGEFRISGLRAGRYKITASPPQGSRASNPKDSGNEQSIYLTTYYPGVLDQGQAVTVEVHAGAETRISFGVLTGRAYRVSGTVSGIPSGGSMAQILLQATASGGSAGEAQQLGEGGRFEFTSVLSGSYVARLLIVTFEGGQPSMQMLRMGQPIEVSNAHVEGLRLQPEAGGHVHGKFRLDTGQKFDWTQLTVALIPADGQGTEMGREGGLSIPTIASVNVDGSFELKNVPGGGYQVAVGAKSNDLRDYFTKSVNLDGRDVADSGFPVHSDPYLDVVISANGASIAGTVVDGKGQPVANASVVDVPNGEHRMRLDLYQQDTTDQSGHFTLRGLNPGEYTVLALEELQEDFRQPEFLRTYETRGETVQLDEGTRKSVVLKLIPQDSGGS